MRAANLQSVEGSDRLRNRPRSRPGPEGWNAESGNLETPRTRGASLENPRKLIREFEAKEPRKGSPPKESAPAMWPEFRSPFSRWKIAEHNAYARPNI